VSGRGGKGDFSRGLGGISTNVKEKKEKSDVKRRVGVQKSSRKGKLFPILWKIMVPIMGFSIAS